MKFVSFNLVKPVQNNCTLRICAEYIGHQSCIARDPHGLCGLKRANYVLQARGQRKGQKAEEESGFLKGVMLMGDLQLKHQLLPQHVSIGINNASHFLDRSKPLPTDLGPWIHPLHVLCSLLELYFSSSKFIFCRDHSTVKPQYKHRCTRYLFDPYGLTEFQRIADSPYENWSTRREECCFGVN